MPIALFIYNRIVEAEENGIPAAFALTVKGLHGHAHYIIYI